MHESRNAARGGLMDRRSSIGLAICLGAAAMGGLMFSLRAGFLSQRSDEVEKAALAAKPVFQTLRFEPFQSAERVQSLAKTAEVVADPPSAELVPALRQAFSEWLAVRFVAVDVGEYQTWRQKNGYLPLDRAELNSAWNHLSKDYKRTFGENLPADFDISKAFVRLWPVTSDKPFNRPVAISSEPAGMIFSLATRKAIEPIYPDLDGSLGSAVWVGNISKYMRSWWKPPRSIEQLGKSSSPIHLGVAGALIEYADGSRRPLTAGFFYDSQEKRWMLDWVAIQNEPSRELEGFEY